MATDSLQNAAAGEHHIGRIPVRNLWFLMLYASDLARVGDVRDILIDEEIDDLPNLIARLLADAVERRLRRNLTRGYRHRETVVTRVRGRIDILITESRLLLSRGEVFCGFAELTIDTPRNRLVRVALERIARLVAGVDLALRCRSLALSLARSGVGGARPSHSDIGKEQIGRNDSTDRYMLSLAELALDLALPTEEAGPTALVAPDREKAWAYRLFEKAVLGFARVEMEPAGWRVRGRVPLKWPVSSATQTIADIFPGMETDIILDAPNQGRRMVIDTKFASILTTGRFGNPGLKSGYLYQMYAYLRSQEGLDQWWDKAAGLFLHPAIDTSLDVHAVIQGHLIRFATVDLTLRPSAIRREMRQILFGGP